MSLFVFLCTGRSVQNQGSYWHQILATEHTGITGNDNQSEVSIKASV